MALSSTFGTQVQGAVKALFTLPTIGLPINSMGNLANWATRNMTNQSHIQLVKSLASMLTTLGIPRGIPIFAYSQQEDGINNIGKQVMLRSGAVGTQVVTDNVAPQPREFTVEGYIAHPTQSTAVPEVNFVLKALNSYTQPIVLTMIKAYFRFLRNLREPFTFVTKDGEAVPVLMKDYRFTEEPESQYATKVSITMQEFIVLDLNGATYELINAPTVGSIFGNPSVFTSIAIKGISSNIKTIAEYIKIKSNTSTSNSKVKLTDDEENEITYLQSLGVTAEDLETLQLDTQHKEFAVAQNVFNGVTADVFSISVPIVLGNTTIQFTLRSDLSDTDWWLDEESGFGKEHTLFGLHKLAHYEKKYTYIIVSPYEWDKEDVKKQLLCMSNASLLIRYN